jgi:Fe-S-cluster containining protein
MIRKNQNFEFECKGCGICCREEGYVFFSNSEIRSAARLLDTTPDKFIKNYLVPFEDGFVHVVLRHGRCAFLQNDNRCAINNVKPRQCKTFPYWEEYIGADGNLVNFNRPCPGVKKQ